MTHASIIPAERIDWNLCRIERYSGNNGVVLKHRPFETSVAEDVLFFIQGEDIGITRQDPNLDAVKRATPLLRVMVDIHNRAVSAAWKEGRKQAKAEIRKALWE